MGRFGSSGRRPGRGRTDRASDMLRGAAVAVAVIGVVASVVLAQGWQSTVTRQRNERLDRTASSRKATITAALANYESALQAARSLWMASGQVQRGGAARHRGRRSEPDRLLPGGLPGQRPLCAG